MHCHKEQKILTHFIKKMLENVNSEICFFEKWHVKYQFKDVLSTYW